MTEVSVGDIIYRAYYFGDEIILDEAKVLSISYAHMDLNEMNAMCKIERVIDHSIHEIITGRIIDEFSVSRVKALKKLFDKHIEVVNKVIEKMEKEEFINGR